MVKRFNLRFNLDKECDLRIWEFLQEINTEEYKSINQFIFLCIDTYIQNLADKQERNTLLEDISNVIKQELQRLVPIAPYQIPIQAIQPMQNQAEQQNSLEEEQIAADFVFNNE